MIVIISEYFFEVSDRKNRQMSLNIPLEKLTVFEKTGVLTKEMRKFLKKRRRELKYRVRYISSI